MTLRDRLYDAVRPLGRVAVAFSGGVDSAVVAQAARNVCERAVAVTAVSASLAEGELERASQIANLIGIEHIVLRTREFENPQYTTNPTNRCYFCKTELYSRMVPFLTDWEVDWICNGANLDDTGDFRPGMQAAREHNVVSPLIQAGFRKTDVRAIAKEWGLPIWDKPASPCLSSRVAYGISVTPERLDRIDRAEQFLKKSLGVSELRVRAEANELARIELPISALEKMALSAFREQVVEEFRRLGFRYITLDLEGFRSGSMNSILPILDTAQE